MNKPRSSNWYGKRDKMGFIYQEWHKKRAIFLKIFLMAALSLVYAIDGRGC